MTSAPLFEGPRFSRPPGGEATRLVAEDDVALRAAFWKGGTRGTVIHLTGRTEFIEKHYEPIAKMIGFGFSVATLDWRGQGLSERALKDRRKGHVESFEEYQRDLDALTAEARRRGMPEPWVLVGHSMGGAIGARNLMRQETTQGPLWRAQAAVLSSPMLGLFGSSPYLALAAGAARASALLGMSEDYAPGGGAEFYAEQGFEANVLTSDQQRFEAYAAFLAAHPELGIGGPTLGWLLAAFREMPQIEPTRTETLLLLGSDEAVVSPSAIRAYARRAPHATLLEIEGARHEPFMETDFIQAQFWPVVDKFLKTRGA